MMKLKPWIIKQIAAENRGGYLEEILGVERETEKALLLRVEWGYTSDLSRHLSVWVPKSAIVTAEDEAAAQARWEAGCKYYEYLINLARAEGVKGVRHGMRAETIKNKLAAAGISYAEKNGTAE